MISYVRQAKEEGYAVLITNPNANFWRHRQANVSMNRWINV
jgi:hypothetical protein